MKLPAIIAISYLAVTARAVWTVTFWSGDNCDGNNLGSTSSATADERCVVVNEFGVINAKTLYWVPIPSSQLIWFTDTTCDGNGNPGGAASEGCYPAVGKESFEVAPCNGCG